MAGLRKTFVIRSIEVIDRLVAFIRSNNRYEKPLYVLVTDADNKRSLEQNALWWSLMRQFSSNAWVDGKQFKPEVWHEYLVRMFGDQEDVTLPDGEIIVRRRSTTEMSVKRFSKMVDESIAYAVTELGVELEAP